MHLSKIELRDWKAYKVADFEFPAPTADQNIILIGAPNGYGKTSLYQAIILSMFGEYGMADIVNSMFSEIGGTQERSYRVFLEKALHRSAIAQGRYSCSVKLVFVDDNGPIEILRNWHFNDSGIYQPNDEEVQVFEGENREPKGPLRELSDQERKNWYSAYIARKLLPHHLATFFVFDGEQVRKLAEREMKDQVKMGIEGLLGIPELHSLSDNLNDYANKRLRNEQKVTNENAKTTRNELEQLEEKLRENLEEYAKISSELSDKKTEKRKIMDHFLTFGMNIETQDIQQHEQLTQCKAAIAKNNAELQKLLSEDIALMLSGARLRKQLKDRLERENSRAKWEYAKQQGDSRIENFLDTMDQQMDGVKPPISDTQKASVLQIARDAWEKLWFPPPPNCAKEYLHPYFSIHDRDIVIDRLNQQGKLGATEIVILLDSISENERRYNRISGELNRLKTVEPTLKEKRSKMEELENIIDMLERKVLQFENERKGLDGQISAKRAELERMYSRIKAAEPARRRAKRAKDVATMLRQIIEKVVPKQMERIGDEMTKAHRSMAHKKNLIQNIKIIDGDVKLLNQKGEDVRSNDLSAGEEQIFTQSLFSAVSAVSERSFPMVVDTPLARLDAEHRSGVLKHLAQRKGQVILLSTDTEVVGSYLQEIDSNIQKKYLIRYSMDDGIGHSIVTLGYFDDSEIKE